MALKKLNPSLKAITLASALLAGAPSAQALSFVFTDVGAVPMSQGFRDAFQAAGDYWSSALTDNVTVYLNIGFGNLPANVLGGASSTFTDLPYATVRAALVADANGMVDNTAVASLQAGPALSFRVNRPDGTSYLDSGNNPLNTQLGLTTANAKALGQPTTTNSSLNPDATITFANAFISQFVTTRVGGVPPGMIDFITTATHEIGHVLGFTSGVDDFDRCIGALNPCSLGPAGFTDNWWAEPLDLFRYSAAGVLNLQVGGNPYFSIDGGVSSIESFSTGSAANGGNGWQPSHFGAGNVNLMRPFLNTGEFYDATGNDLTAFDVIGWDMAVAVPEPGTYSLLLAGIAGVAGWARRRQPT
jgi:PEP-CTERM motif